LENATTTMSTLTSGIDLGDRHSHLCLLDDSGTVVEAARLAATPDAFRRRFAGLWRARIAIEVGTHSPWVSALLAAVWINPPVKSRETRRCCSINFHAGCLRIVDDYRAAPQGTFSSDSRRISRASFQPMAGRPTRRLRDLRRQ